MRSRAGRHLGRAAAGAQGKKVSSAPVLSLLPVEGAGAVGLADILAGLLPELKGKSK